MNNDEDKTRQRNKDATERAALFWIELANHQVFELSKQFFSLSSLLMTISASIIALSNLNLQESELYILFFSWISFIISILSGLAQIIVDVKYFHYLAKDNSTRAQMWSKRNISFHDSREKIENLGQTNESSGHMYLIIQGFSAIMGLILLLWLAMIIIVNK